MSNLLNQKTLNTNFNRTRKEIIFTKSKGEEMDLKELAMCIVNGSLPKAKELTQAAIDEGIDLKRIIEEGLIAGMNEIGELFERQEVYLPELILAGRAMQGAMELIEPRLMSSQIRPMGKVVLGTVKGDHHDIGKRLVGVVMKGAGFEVLDLGIDVPPERFVEAARQGADIIGMSALIGPTMASMKLTIDALKEAGLTGKVKTMVGGAIVTQEFADKIGADAYAQDAFVAARKARELLGL
jgi:5-methyltetrahydrofolate--homocysteine methyltransferase